MVGFSLGSALGLHAQVKDDDDLDMSTLGKPVSSLAKPTASATSAVQQPTTPDQADGPPTKSKASKSGKSGKSNAGDNIWCVAAASFAAPLSLNAAGPAGAAGCGQASGRPGGMSSSP